MWLVAEEDVLQVIEGVDIQKGERVLMEMSRKFTPEDIRQLAFQSNFYVQVSVCTVLTAGCAHAQCMLTLLLHAHDRLVIQVSTHFAQ